MRFRHSRKSRTSSDRGCLLIGGVLLLPLIFEVAPYWKRVINYMCVYAMLAIAFDFLANYVGLVCLGGALFIGVGGYLTAIFNTYFSLPIYLSIPFATVGGACICTAIILPCLPLRGVYFAIVTLMYPILISRIIEALNIFGGTNGITGIAGFPNQYLEQYLIIIVMLLVLFAMRRLVVEDVGLVLRGVKDNDQSVRASGINVTYMKCYSCVYRIAHGMFCRSLYLPSLYVRRSFALCT